MPVCIPIPIIATPLHLLHLSQTRNPRTGRGGHSFRYEKYTREHSLTNQTIAAITSDAGIPVFYTIMSNSVPEITKEACILCSKM